MEINKGKFVVWFGELSKGKKVLTVLLVIVAVGAFFMIGRDLIAKEARDIKRIELEKAVNAVIFEEGKIKDDKYGGGTPYETKDLFVGALKKGDIDLAGKYFISSSKEESEKIVENFEKTAQMMGIDQIVDIVEQMVPDDKYGVEGVTFNFVKYNEKGERDYGMELVKTKFGIWKIKSL